MADQIMAADKSRLKTRICARPCRGILGALSPTDLAAVETAIWRSKYTLIN
jgi:hypothetical protein